MSIPDENFIKIDTNERNLPIYRVVPAWRFAEILVTRKLVLTRPDLWDDPFENILLKTQLELPDGTPVGLDGVMGAFYGQCWSLHEETDAMWRIYAPGRDGVTLRTTIAKLMGAVYDFGNPDADRQFFIGRVLYEEEGELMNVFSGMSPEKCMALITDHTFYCQAVTLLAKRKAFEHEREVRLLYRSPQTTDARTKAFPVDPNSVIDCVVFDPRMGDTEYHVWHRLMEQAGYKGEVRRSSLYSLPKLRLRPG
jgi:hypothetical protein